MFCVETLDLFVGVCKQDPYNVLEIISLGCVCVFVRSKPGLIKFVICLTLIDICEVGFD